MLRRDLAPNIDQANVDALGCIRHVETLHHVALRGLDKRQRKDERLRFLGEHGARDDEGGQRGAVRLGQCDQVRDVPLRYDIQSRDIDLFAHK